MNQQVKVLFVCMGNICRSPAGEGVFRHYVNNAGDGDVIQIASAGISDYHAGSPADQRMRQAAARRGYALTSIARQVLSEDIDRHDLIIAMDHDNLAGLEHLAQGVRPHVRLLGTFLGQSVTNAKAPAVPDPYYGGMDGFEEVLDMIERACPAMLACSLVILQTKGR